jgi:putative salt-induced outer membrane protein
MKQTIVLVLLSLSLSIPCAPVPGQEPGPRRWRDQAELAFVNTTGNSEVLTIAVKNVLDYKLTPRLNGNWKIGALKGKTQGETTAERYYSDLRFDYTF